MSNLFRRSFAKENLFRRSTAIFFRWKSPNGICTSSRREEEGFTDFEENVTNDLCFADDGILQIPDNALSWFEDAKKEMSVEEMVVNCNWDEQKVGGRRKRGEEMEISKLFISNEIVRRLKERGITRLFPIQRAVLDPAMRGRDLICRAKTGTGKTLAYAIPIMDRIIRFKAAPQAKYRRGRNPLALILTPTRELSQQVTEEFKESSFLKIVSVCGGEPLARQLNELNYGVDVLVGTPGRINDFLSRNILNLCHVQSVVLDESDEMLSLSFAEVVEKILQILPRRHQSIMFSSTLPSWMNEFHDIYLNDPLLIDLVGDDAKKLPDGIAFYSIMSDGYQKASIIVPLITNHAKGGKCILFTQSKCDISNLSNFIGRSLKCKPLHACMHQNCRKETLTAFRDGKFNILVASDVAARGLHIPDVDLVIHYEVPSLSENFIHRSGRTGRAGRRGKVILIYTEDQAKDVLKIERDIGCKFEELPMMVAGSHFGFSAHGASSNLLMHADVLSDRSGLMKHSHHGGNRELRKSRQKSDFSSINSNLCRNLDVMVENNKENDFSISGSGPISSKNSNNSRFDSISHKIIDIIFKATSTSRENNATINNHDCEEKHPSNEPDSGSGSFDDLSNSSYASKKP